LTSFDKLKSKVLISIGFGVLVYLAMSLFADLPRMAHTLARFAWLLLPLILGLTLFNYGLRFVKWDYYIHQLGIHTVSKKDSAGIFTAGLTMAMTPGKVGELLKSYLLKQVSGAPMAGTAPIVVAERLTDGIALLFLAAGGLILYQYGWQILGFVFLLAVAIIVVSQNRRLAFAIFAFGERLPLISKIMHHIHSFYDGAQQLLSLKNLLFAIGIGFISWAGECVAFFLVLTGLGVEPSWLLLIQAAFILAASTLIGSASMLPGGLGAADVSVAGMLILLVQSPIMTQDVAVAATLLIRFCTLWFGVSIGLVSLFIFQRRLTQVPAPQSEEAGVGI
jgi:glycosyltransferase 2 family protein